MLEKKSSSRLRTPNSIVVAGLLGLLLACVAAAPAADDFPAVVGELLARGDLPDDFYFPFLQLDFAVLRVTVTNNSEQNWSLQPEKLTLKDPKGKSLKRVRPTDITPRIIQSKAFRHSQARVAGQVGYPYPPTYGENGQVPPYRTNPVQTIPSGPRVLSVDTAKQIRATLEKHEVKEVMVAPGETFEGLVYYRSKKSASKLSGSTLEVSGGRRVQVQ